MKSDEIQQERDRLLKLFQNAEPVKAELVDGLIWDAAYLKVENDCLRQLMTETGMVKVHPVNKDIQKPVEAARQYRQNVNSYAVIIKTLNSILGKDADDEEDGYDKWLKEKQQQ